MVCCIVMALIWGVLLGAKTWLTGDGRRPSGAQGWRLTGQAETQHE